MNSIIKDIIEQSSNVSRRTIPEPENKFREGVMVKYNVDTEKVAELMLQKCIDNLLLNGYDDAAESIKKNFGVDK